MAGAGYDEGRARIHLFVKLAQGARGLLDDLVTTAFPSDCRICSAPLLRAGVIPVCDDCRASLAPQSVPACDCCGEALDIDFESARIAAATLSDGLLCRECRLAPPAFERAVAYGTYEGELREMVHLLKYEQMRGLATLLGARLADAILTLRTSASEELLVVPVPLFAGKRRERGYNQAAVLADAAITELRRRAPEWTLRRADGALVRRRDTRSQFELNPTSRRRNLAGAFEADASRIPAGCEVLVVDDIYTTGATARECSKVLRRAGAGKVWVATLARAQKPHVAFWEENHTHPAHEFG